MTEIEKKSHFKFSKKEFIRYFKDDLPINTSSQCQICKNAILVTYNIPHFLNAPITRFFHYVPQPNCYKCEYYPKPQPSLSFEEVENLQIRLLKTDDLCQFCGYDRIRKATDEPCLSCIHNIEIDDKEE